MKRSGYKTYHIKVEVGADLGELRVGGVELLDVVVRAQLAVLLGAPEGEADGVLDLEVGEGLTNAENTNSARTIVAVDYLLITMFAYAR